MIKTNIKNIDPYICLYSDVFNKKTIEETERIIPDDYKETVDSIVNGTSGLNFTEMERDYIAQHYLLKKTNIQYAFKNDISTPAVNEIHNNVLRKCRRGSYRDFLKLGLEKWKIRIENGEIEIMDEGILPARIHNALRRYGIDTTDKLKELSHDDIHNRIRNLGPKSISELIKICQSYNISTRFMSPERVIYLVTFWNGWENDGTCDFDGDCVCEEVNICICLSEGEAEEKVKKLNEILEEDRLLIDYYLCNGIRDGADKVRKKYEKLSPNVYLTNAEYRYSKIKRG